MGRFDQGGRRGGFSGGRDRPRGGFGGGFSRDRRPERRSNEMFDATCSNCGKACQVPFKPTGSKPVLCSECFEKQGDRRSSGSGNSEEIKQINAKLDKIIAILQDLELEVDEESDSDKSEDEEEN